ncbi:hypothetical protein POM88_025896 [Heracleum sosnowskyi]|uniref:Uncharacterized protein n=1 Tax=Heracleum sosnowskyi TaxID=360622 RepID=A0AAD8I708_9APIA|nr:hypothetical protein POM88_025896 [Heracleum sosnowskyi]
MEVVENPELSHALLPQPALTFLTNSSEAIIDSPKQSLASDVLTSRSSKEAIHKDNSLKAAIEAALLKKPGIYRKNKVHDQSAGIAVSGNINSEVCSQDQQSNTHNPRKLVPGEEASRAQHLREEITLDKEKKYNSRQFIVIEATRGPNKSHNVPITILANKAPETAAIPAFPMSVEVKLRLARIRGIRGGAAKVDTKQAKKDIQDR